MAYFDSPKNRAIWERRLSELRQEREYRRETGFRPVERSEAPVQTEDTPFRRRISLQELEKQELARMEEKRVRMGERLRTAGKQKREDEVSRTARPQEKKSETLSQKGMQR
ncbi:MAG: hypothetical protein Q4C63_03110 [Eubacteriales bacterium]|nr:hypothetical protein [Eubacteriales bacterium]